MDVYDEERLRNEVIYLHSLWHQGPPRRANHFHSSSSRPRGPLGAAPPPHHHQQFNSSNYSASARILHHPSNPTQFKNRRNKRKRNKKDKLTQLLSQSPGKEWPCNPSSGTDPPASSGDWNSDWPKVHSEPRLQSSEEEAKLAAKRAQSKALSLTKEYLSISSDDENDDMEEDDDDKCEEYRFFVKLFGENKELNEFYNNKNQNGEFVCLVCGGLGKKLAGKKYKGCVALVQHSISIAKTKNRITHRAYGQAICKVLGWDINNLSSIVSAMAENHKKPAALADAGTTENEGDALANIGELGKDSLAALESRDCLVNSSDMAIVDEVAEDGSAAVECKEGEGSADVTVPCQAELCDKKCNPGENVDEGTENCLITLESMEAPLHACIGSVLPTKGSCSGGNSEISGEATLFLQNSESKDAGGKAAGDLDEAVAMMVYHKQCVLASVNLPFRKAFAVETALEHQNWIMENSGSEAAEGKTSGGSDLTLTLVEAEDATLNHQLKCALGMSNGLWIDYHYNQYRNLLFVCSKMMQARFKNALLDNLGRVESQKIDKEAPTGDENITVRCSAISIFTSNGRRSNPSPPPPPGAGVAPPPHEPCRHLPPAFPPPPPEVNPFPPPVNEAVETLQYQQHLDLQKQLIESQPHADSQSAVFVDPGAADTEVSQLLHLLVEERGSLLVVVVVEMLVVNGDKVHGGGATVAPSGDGGGGGGFERLPLLVKILGKQLKTTEEDLVVSGKLLLAVWHKGFFEQYMRAERNELRHSLLLTPQDSIEDAILETESLLLAQTKMFVSTLQEIQALVDLRSRIGVGVERGWLWNPDVRICGVDLPSEELAEMMQFITLNKFHLFCSYTKRGSTINSSRETAFSSTLTWRCLPAPKPKPRAPLEFDSIQVVLLDHKLMQNKSTTFITNFSSFGDAPKKEATPHMPSPLPTQTRKLANQNLNKKKMIIEEITTEPKSEVEIVSKNCCRRRRQQYTALGFFVNPKHNLNPGFINPRPEPPFFIYTSNKGKKLAEGTWGNLRKTLSFLANHQFEIVASSNGFLLCRRNNPTMQYMDDQCLICNPATGQFRYIPNPRADCYSAPIILLSEESNASSSLSLDDVHHQVFLVSQAQNPMPCLVVEYFCSSVNKWKQGTLFVDSRFPWNLEKHVPPFTIQGVIFWTATFHSPYGYDTALLAYDCNAKLPKRAIVIPAPPRQNHVENQAGFFGQAEGKLHCARRDLDDFEIWVLEDYKRRDCWMMKHRVRLSFPGGIMEWLGIEVDWRSGMWLGPEVLSFYPENSGLVFMKLGVKTFCYDFVSRQIRGRVYSFGPLNQFFLYQWPSHIVEF
ncbi:OLC1v1023249C1 [Oldenlandia corymbosa var. corymbosa]|uniref:OLC1v1023249C1 n=1 Tax=Oldenlandia corymbosa var. corymbosa TaxID=529605 RepID=A0AAV1C209_OLDCO|nr:OLC1v1023249C1 [Oldenlandia corymbosa var. corymbosa]